jgi:hypothetical protein
MPDRNRPGRCRELIAGTKHQVSLRLTIEKRGVLVNPAMDPDLMSGIHDPPSLVRIDEGNDGRQEKGGGNAVTIEKRQNTRHSYTSAELTPCQPSHRRPTGTKLEGFVVAIER